MSTPSPPPPTSALRGPRLYHPSFGASKSYGFESKARQDRSRGSGNVGAGAAASGRRYHGRREGGLGPWDRPQCRFFYTLVTRKRPTAGNCTMGKRGLSSELPRTASWNSAAAPCSLPSAQRSVANAFGWPRIKFLRKKWKTELVNGVVKTERVRVSYRLSPRKRLRHVTQTLLSQQFDQKRKRITRFRFAFSGFP